MNRVFTPRDVQSGCVHLPVRAHWAATPSLQMADGPTQEERMNLLYSPGSRALSASETLLSSSVSAFFLKLLICFRMFICFAILPNTLKTIL